MTTTFAEIAEREARREGTTSTMKAVRIHEYGGADVLAYEDAPRPRAGAGEVVIRVRAAGVNPVDAHVREGNLKEMLGSRLPLILGWDVSGVIEEVGDGASGFEVGDEVYAFADLRRDGAYAEFVLVDAAFVARKPRSLDFVRAAGVPLVALTAWQSLFDKAGLSRGQTVLVHAAAGGVGHFAVQFAKHAGARVIGTASTRNLEFVRGLGADEVIDYKSARFEEESGEVDVVLDLVGGETQARSWQVLKRGGVLVTTQPTSSPSPELAAARGARGEVVYVQPDAAQLAEIARLIDAGHVETTVSIVLPLEAVREAHEQVQDGHTRGKIVLQIGS